MSNCFLASIAASPAPLRDQTTGRVLAADAAARAIKSAQRRRAKFDNAVGVCLKAACVEAGWSHHVRSKSPAFDFPEAGDKEAILHGSCAPIGSLSGRMPRSHCPARPARAGHHHHLRTGTNSWAATPTADSARGRLGLCLRDEA